MIEVRFKDIDPDTGFISQDSLIAVCATERTANWVLQALINDSDGNEPNREYYMGGTAASLGTYEQRVGWLLSSQYETGMEYSIMLESLREKDLSNLEWTNGIINVPVLCKHLVI